LSILQELQERVKSALKAGHKQEVSALRMIVNELQKAAKESRGELDDNAEHQVLRREYKRRLESIEAFRAGGREDLAVHEEYAARIVEGLLPRQLDEAALGKLVEEAIAETSATSARDMGKVMALLMPKVKGRADGKLVNLLVKEMLN